MDKPQLVSTLEAKAKKIIACLPFADNLAGHAETAEFILELLAEVRARDVELASLRLLIQAQAHHQEENLVLRRKMRNMQDQLDQYDERFHKLRGDR